MPNVYFTSDQHYGHTNIIQYSKRPFDDIIEMRETFVTNYNSAVQPNDTVYHLGDFAFLKVDEAVKILKRLNGNKYLIFGNHDKRLRKEPDFLKHWGWTKDLAEITVNEQKIVLCHYAMLTWNGSHRGSWNLHGHSHGSLPEDKFTKRLDVGVDCHSYYPISFNEVKITMDKKEFKPVDHHGARECDECSGSGCDNCKGRGVV